MNNNNNILDNCTSINSNTSNIEKDSSKLSYILQEKTNMTIQLNQLKLNNQVLRNVISNLHHHQNNSNSHRSKQNQQQVQQSNTINSRSSPSPSIQLLISRNNQLEQQLQKIMEYFSSQQAQIFLKKQIAQYNEKQMHQIINNYQQKILQLRKLVQNKQCAIQRFEDQMALNQDFEQIVIPPYNVSMHFYAQIQEYKILLENYKKKFYDAEKQNAKLKENNQYMLLKINGLQNTLKIRSSYLLYQQQYQNGYKNKSEQKRGINFNMNNNNNNKKFQKNDNIYHKTEVTIYQDQRTYNISINNYKRIIFKMKVNIEKLNDRINKLQVKNRLLAKVKDTLINSNKFYQETRKNLQVKYDRERAILNQVLNVCMRKQNNQQFISSIDDNHNEINKLIQKAIQKRNQQKNNKIPRKQLWKTIAHMTPVISQNKMYCFKQSDNTRKRSYSSVLDYICSSNNDNDVYEDNAEDCNILQQSEKRQHQEQEYNKYPEKKLQESFGSIFGGNDEDFSIIMGNNAHKINHFKRGVRNQEINYMIPDDF